MKLTEQGRQRTYNVTLYGFFT